jgi:hypothetical protein
LASQGHENDLCGTNPISRVRQRRAGPMVQNKPNFRWPGYPTIRVFYHSTIPVRGQLCETKPNFGGIGCLGKEQYCMIGSSPESKTCETNPICRPPHRGRRDQSCETKPIPRLGIADGAQSCGGTPALRPAASGLQKAKCAKRTQFASARGKTGSPMGGRCKTNPIGWGEMGKTKPIRPDLGGAASPAGERSGTNPIRGPRLSASPARRER